ncbi:YceI family protein [Maribacter sp. PR1]|uniref:YceI family protein n=1 Tax=Maribacter cobaltidurans TaxID=1178778 RepID=A0ABU7IV99_9FLAO|nr:MULTISPECIES: YceI family protein [Maribacter]MDC6389333.1 YceI family protein [Maribacter sp. PR1]MEE1976721.1 YceI family protein [Maribacter cobaltidurans]
MKKNLSLLALVFCSVLTAQSTWTADKAHSKIGFAVTHLLISEVDGNFDEFEISATAGDTFMDPTFDVSITTSSVDTDNERRDGHLKSSDFFDVEAHPTMTFKTTSVEKTGDNTFKMTGDLTMHGVTKPVTLEGKVNGVITDQRSQKLKAGLKLTGTIDRTEFGVGEESATIGSEIDMTINLEMAQQ